MLCRTFKHNGSAAKIFHGLVKILERDDVVVLYYPVGTRADVVNKNTHWIMRYSAYKIFPVGADYNFIIVEKENGNEYYCNMASPPTITADEITYVDYDIDVVLTPEGEIEVHDVEQFSERIVSYNYPPELVDRILATQKKIEADLAARSGYFAPDFYRELCVLLDNTNNARTLIG